ncbi:MAG: hypothetical protein RLN96_01715, partial [Pseudomonadales bacterium]
MTRLIEALKRAEEAKRKEKTPKKSQDFSLELEEQDAPDDGQDEPEYKPGIPESDSGLSLEQEPSGTPEPHSDQTDSKAATEDTVFEPAPVYQTEAEHQSTAEFDSTPDSSEAEDTGRRLTDHGTSLRPGSTSPDTGRNRRLGIFALVALLLLGGVFAFLYWQINSQSNPYANLAPVDGNRGFLDTTPNQETAQPSGLESTESDTTAQTQNQPQTQTVIGPAVNEPPENPNQPVPDETITAVNALIATPAQTSPEPEVTARRTVVFNIENVQRIPGSDDAMAFARANMQQGEWEAA